MQICLDYYRILGLPIHTSADRIESAYSDRIQQLPQHEYSEAAIVSRHDFLTEAYEVLSSAEKRIRYDALLIKRIGSTSAEDSQDEATTEDNRNIEIYAPPSLDVTPDKLVGALLVLYELGEYQQILQLAQPYLEKPRLSFSLESELELDRSQWRDLILVSGLAYLEVGREQWQKREYELAAHILESGKDLLAKESLFNSLIEEIQTEIYKLRPYRILELISLEEDKVSERMQGLQMLKEMLDARGGINGNKNDRSGLKTEDFLRFIQQLRAYLTSVEQQAFFELEARRPSEVASYLAVCALLGRGFDQRQPNLIVKAKEMLLQLSQRRDVHLERAICALLLRQIEEAGRAVELSSDEEAVNIIRQISENEPDLLAGLCEYTEKWLEKEIFPYFRDLMNKRAVLKAYFLDETVQEYLTQINLHRDSPESLAETATENLALETPSEPLPPVEYSSNNARHLTAENMYGTKIPKANVERSPVSLAEERIAIASQDNTSSSRSPGEIRREKRRVIRNRQPRRYKSLKPILFALLGLGLLISGIGWAVSRQTSQVKVANSPPAKSPIAAASITPTPASEAVKTTQASSEPMKVSAPAGTLDKIQAKEIVQSWLDTKAKARGKGHEIAKLDNILAQPALSDQKKRAEGDLKSNSHWEYEHSFTIKSVQIDAKDKKLASIDANVLEKSQLYRDGKLKSANSGSDDLLVRYNLVRSGDIWLIKEIKVLN